MCSVGSRRQALNANLMFEHFELLTTLETSRYPVGNLWKCDVET